MKSDRFQCPLCQHLLQKAFVPHNSLKEQWVMLWCGNVSRCPSERAANDGGSGPTEEAAYRALLLAVKHEEDKETERECEPLSPEDPKDKNAWAVAERKNDLAKSGGG